MRIAHTICINELLANTDFVVYKTVRNIKQKEHVKINNPILYPSKYGLKGFVGGVKFSVYRAIEDILNSLI